MVTEKERKMKPSLFESATLGRIQLKNRIVMAPMTRSRAIGNLANDLMADYYGQRASSGLIITEGVSPSPNGLGYARIPALYNEAHVKSWKKVTQEVHARGGRIFAQIMHTGRVSHPANMPEGSRILAPSAIQLGGMMWTDSQGQQPHPVPQEMNLDDIQEAISEYAKSAELAIEAGFDGVELHAANGYLIEQFLNPNTNKRTDQYGGSDENRMRFALEIAKAVTSRIGADRTGLRVSPNGVFNETGTFKGVEDFYAQFSARLSDLGLVYIHVIDPGSLGDLQVNQKIKRLIRSNFKGTYILSNGYDQERAQKDLEQGKGDLVAFGRPFISNPDLVERLERGISLTEMDPSTLYTPGEKGYTTYAMATR